MNSLFVIFIILLFLHFYKYAAGYVWKRIFLLEELRHKISSNIFASMKFNYSDLKLEDFEVGDRIGNGGFGTVYCAKCLKPGYGIDSVAIKKISKEKLMQDKTRWKYVENEISINKRLTHPNIVKCYTTFEDKNFVYLVLELCKQSLGEYLEKGQVNGILAVNIIKQVVNGMLHLYQKNIVHRDISIGNILMKTDYIVKIADFGFGTTEKKLTTQLGTAHFISPEIKNGESYDYKSDSYSLGVVIYLILGGKLPLNKASINTDNFKPTAVKLMKDLLENLAEKRVGINEVLSYEFFNEYEGSEYPKTKNDSLRNKDSGMGLSNSLSTSGKNHHQTSKNVDSGLDSFNSSLKELKRRRCLPNLYPKTSGRTHKQYMSSNSKRERNEERQRHESTHYSSERPYLLNYENQTLHSRNNLPKRVSPPIHSNHSSRERSVSEARRKQELKQNSSIFEGNGTNHQNPISLISEKKISQEKNSLNRQESLALNSKHSSCSSQSRKNLPSKKSQHGSSSLEQKPQRLNATRLRPQRFPFKKIAVVSILEKEEVCIEWLKIKKEKQFVSKVLHISDNKDVILAYQPKHCLLGPQPPPKPGNTEEIQDFSFDALPTPYWKMYHIAKSIVDLARAGTPKITCFKEGFKFVVMENDPDPDLHMEFFDGGKIQQISNKVSIFDRSGKIVENMDDHFSAMHEKFLNMKAWCRQMEAQLKTLNITFDYPITFGDSTKYHSKNISV